MAGSETGKKLSPAEAYKKNVLLAFLCSGVIISFTVFGHTQETVTQTLYGGERFKFPTFLIVAQSFCNTLIAGSILWAKGIKNWSGGASLKDWMIAGTGFCGAHEFGFWALSYIPFPLQVVCKSCKAVPVMLGEKILAKKKHSRSKEIEVVLMTLGVVVFALFGSSKSKSFALSLSLVFGLFLVLCALVCDGIYGPYQNTICQRFNPTAFHLMFNMNLVEFGLASLICLVDGELTGGLNFIMKHPEILSPLAFFAVAMGVGNLFIYGLQNNFGALTVATTTTLRKLISVLFSVFWFGHHLAPTQWVAAVIVFLAKPAAGALAKVFPGAGAKKVSTPKIL